MEKWFDEALFDRLRQERGVAWGRPLRLSDHAASTNDLGLEAVAGAAKTGIVWLAREQSAGRGRRGNTWHAAPGEALLTSILVRVPAPRELGAGFSLLTGLAVREVVASRVAGRVQVKWPNDVLIAGAKCSGILVESRSGEGGASLGVVLGIGLNVSTAQFPDALPGATSLLLAGAADLGIEGLLVDLLGALERRVRVFLPKGLGPLLRELDEYDYLRGRTVRIGECVGTAAGFDEEGRLCLSTASGSRAVHVGHVELLDAHSGENTSG